MLWTDAITEMPTCKYADWRINSLPHRAFICLVEKLNVNKKPVSLTGVKQGNQFFAILTDGDGTYFLEIKEPPHWKYLFEEEVE